MEIDLNRIRRPQRYIGHEWNLPRKNHSVKINICIAYPDLYEVGMSNLGIRIIYGQLNSHDDVLCERVFMPAEDMISFLEQENRPLASLETKNPLYRFEVVGFNLGCELNCLNMLKMLELGRIEVKSSLRKNHLIIAGGVANPEPFAEFIDVFFMGEFEEKSDEFIRILRAHPSKEARLLEMSQTEGFYVPAYYEEDSAGGGKILKKKHPAAMLPIKRVWVKDLDKAYFPHKWITPHTPIAQDRVPVEVARGCPNLCTFCQARALYFPYRQRRISTVLDLIKKIYKNSGYENYSLLSLSASDYSGLKGLIEEGYDFFSKNRIGLALPSLRIDDLLGEIYSKLLPLKKISLTVALEAGSARLRESLNKNIDTEKIFEAVARIKHLGLKRIKIYCLFGFEQETEDDLLDIGYFIKTLLSKTGLQISASINAFIPKPFSLWQDVSMIKEEELRKKRAAIISGLPHSRKLKVSFSSIEASLIEAAICRADRKFSKVIYRVYKSGKISSSSYGNFSRAAWDEAAEKEKIDYREYFHTARERRGRPWSFIETAPAKRDTQ